MTSGVGGQLQTTANLWQIYALTNSPLQVGLNGLARAVPIILFSLIGGVIADRIDRKKIIVFTQTANALSVTAPSSANLCPPGHYMLFILKNGVPSIAQIIQIQ